MTNNSMRISYFSLVNFKQVEYNQERAKLEQSTLISVFIPTFVTFSHQKSINSLQHFVISPHYWSIQLICEFTNICVCTSVLPSSFQKYYRQVPWQATKKVCPKKNTQTHISGFSFDENYFCVIHTYQQLYTS